MKGVNKKTQVVDSDYEIIKQGKVSSAIDTADERRPLGIVGRLLSGLKARVWTRDVQARRELVRESTGMIKDVHEYAVESAKLDLVPQEIKAMEIQMKAKVLEEQYNYNEVEHKLNQQPTTLSRADELAEKQHQVNVAQIDQQLHNIQKQGEEDQEERRMRRCYEILNANRARLRMVEIDLLGEYVEKINIPEQKSLLLELNLRNQTDIISSLERLIVQGTKPKRLQKIINSILEAANSTEYDELKSRRIFAKEAAEDRGARKQIMQEINWWEDFEKMSCARIDQEKAAGLISEEEAGRRKQRIKNSVAAKIQELEMALS